MQIRRPRTTNVHVKREYNFGKVIKGSAKKVAKGFFKCLLLQGAMFASWATLTLISGTRRGIQYPFQTDFWKSIPTQNGDCLHVTSAEKISSEFLVTYTRKLTVHV